MIKLIVTDMDGTLLNQEGKLPKDFFSTLDKLKAKNIKFVVASGRPYVTLHNNFDPISDELDFICDNGAFIVENGQVASIAIMDKTKVNEIIKFYDNIPDIEIVLCGIKNAYHHSLSTDFAKEIDKYYLKYETIDDLTTVDDDIFKVSICNLNGSATNCYKVLEPIFNEYFNIVVSGATWVDLMRKGINKGSALEKIQKDEGISYEETMVFGDFYNDVEMLGKAHYSFVMENANDDMKQYGNFIAKRNTENGVIKAIEKYVLK
ncbi:Flavin mononucleotide phosphatase YbjI [Clostridium vincentii]|uniref:Flavin mononucleotide phosphatase YbjI n=2 Tax=Clostridium vincentii TaxID=52704 RepID=A0A2T0BJ50_9CLOT|nr:HAD family hydrolase [Clostridium vincentii]PRR83900.1 Flavin mononucleotide phosphatase YbjI [Clostridium vincentii]